jgi:protein SCO1/2
MGFTLQVQALPLPWFSKQDMTPYWPKEQPTLSPATMPTKLRLVDQKNRSIGELRAEISLVNFFFTSCPSVCPTMMNQIESYRANLPRDLRLHIYSISVDPKTDQPAKLSAYANRHHLNLSNWSLLTGDRQDIYRIGREVFHADGSQTSANFIHTTNLYLLDTKHRIRGIYDSKSAKDMALLTKDLKKLSREN